MSSLIVDVGSAFLDEASEAVSEVDLAEAKEGEEEEAEGWEADLSMGKVRSLSLGVVVSDLSRRLSPATAWLRRLGEDRLVRASEW